MHVFWKDHVVLGRPHPLAGVDHVQGPHGEDNHRSIEQVCETTGEYMGPAEDENVLTEPQLGGNDLAVPAVGELSGTIDGTKRMRSLVRKGGAWIQRARHTGSECT